MTIYHFHPQNGLLVGASEADASPLAPGEFIIPAFATLTEPPAPEEGKNRAWNGSAWVMQDIPPAPEPEPEPEPTAPTVESFATMQGYGAFQLIDLKDMEDKLHAASIEIPTKAAAVRAWVDSVRLAFATAQTPANAPHSYEEVLAEVLPILNP